MTIIVGIDVGYARLGVGYIERDPLSYIHCETLIQPAAIEKESIPFPKRLVMMEENLISSLVIYKPSVAAIEQPGNLGNSTSVIQAMGVIQLVLARLDITPFLYSPSLVKKYLSGDGRCEKEQIEEIVNKRLNINLHNIEANRKGIETNDGKFNDAIDALSIALTYHYDQGASVNRNQPRKKARK